MSINKETRGKQNFWRGKKRRGLALFLVCVTLLSLLAACGETSSPTGQPGAVATATEQVTTSSATTIAATTAAPTTTQADTTAAVSTTSAPATTTTVPPTTNASTTEAVTTVLPTTAAPTTTVVATTTAVVPTKPAATATPRPAPVATTTVPAKASGGQSHTFTEKDNNGSVQLKVGDTLLAQLNPELDWNFEVIPNNGVLSAPTPAAKPYEDSFKALAAGTVQIKAFGKCHPVPDKVCFQAIISQIVTVNVS